MLDFFLKICNIGFFVSFVIGKFYANNEKDLPYKFQPAHTVKHRRTRGSLFIQLPLVPYNVTESIVNYKIYLVFFPKF